jgi:hypothetical protein
MKRTIILTAAASSALTLLAVWAAGWASKVSSTTKLENAKVKVTEVTYSPGAPRDSFVRAGDQVVVFLDECRYERTDAVTKTKEVRNRKPGEVIWHNKGENAPQLVNLGKTAFRTIVVELK